MCYAPDLAFACDSDETDVLWTTHSTGSFSQIDLRECTKPLDSINTAGAATWDPQGYLTFVSPNANKSRHGGWIVPYDDMCVL
jgi:WD repeat-containing protein 24